MADDSTGPNPPSGEVPGRLSRALAQIAGHSIRVRVDLPLVLFDVLFVCTAYGGALAIRFEGLVPPEYWRAFLAFLPIAVALHVATNALAGLYGQVWHQAGIDDARRVIVAGTSATAILGMAFLLVERLLPITVVVLGGLATLLLIGLLRFQYRLFAFQRQRKWDGDTRVVVLGAGHAGSSIVRELQRKPTGMRPVAILDDAIRMRGRLLAGVPVLGRLSDLPRVAADLDALIALLAIPSASGELVREVAETARAANLELKVLPSVAEFVGRAASVRDLRDVSITDLLGRQQVQTDLKAVLALLAGKRVLITGGGGSIGGEIARQVAACAPAELVLLDHDETHLFDAAARIDSACVQELASIRDPAALHAVFARHRPEVVFHAAALKHVPILEAHPVEAVRTNVDGTQNVLEAAHAVAVNRLVFISTDKAVNPTSVMGATKQLGEQLVLRGRGAPMSCAVRFGNVLGSRGSVVPTFMRQLATGGPITVTHPEMTRFFMSIEEAVQLVLQAAALSTGGEIFMLDMGNPVKIMDLARNMIHLSGQTEETVEITVTGLRPGEKLTEELHTSFEEPQPTAHPSIIQLRPNLHRDDHFDATLERLRGLVSRRQDTAVTELLILLAASPEASVVLEESELAGPRP